MRDIKKSLIVCELVARKAATTTYALLTGSAVKALWVFAFRDNF
jgi:hypothetical protein